MRIALACIAPLAFLAACATPYGPLGLAGGVEATQLDATTFTIRADGNGYTRPAVMQEYVLLKAAEIAKQRGFSHFAVLTAEGGARTGAFTTAGTYSGTTTFSGGYASTSGTYTPGVTIPIHFPNHQAMVRLQKNGDAVPGAIVLEAESVYSNLAPRHIKAK